MKSVAYIALAVLSFWFLSSCDRSRISKQKKVEKNQVEGKAKKEIQREKREKLVKKLAEKHNALTIDEWDPNGTKDPEWEYPSKLSLDYHLVNDEGRPALLIGYLLDAYQDHNKYFLKFRTGNPIFYSSYFGRRFNLSLNCPKEMVYKVVKTNVKMKQFVIVAKFHELRKIDSIFGIDDPDKENPLIEMKSANNFIAKGSCIEIQPLPN